MIYKGNKPIDTVYVGGKLVQQAYLGGKKIYPEHGVIPKAIKDAMVLWYDLKRQGATNESMAAAPTLRDLSGNGHDATCYNFAWRGMSGIGGYNLTNVRSNYSTTYPITIYGTKYSFLNNSEKEILSSTLVGYSNAVSEFNYDSDIIFKAGSKGLIIRRTQDAGKNAFILKELQPNEEAIINIPENYEDGTYKYIMFSPLLNTPIGDIFDFEQIPLYPHALVSDGVDDYARREGVTLGENWTLLFDADWWQEEGVTQTSSAGVVKQDCFFIYNAAWQNRIAVFIKHGGDSYGVPLNSFVFRSDDTIFDTDYNEYHTGEPQVFTGGDAALNIFGRQYSSFTTMALRKLLLFDRALSLDEIKWVKTNLMN